jgi:ectoine hydroxylase-related dioxygenase (phytanoyl-CoA dioxygenase family)
MAHPIKERVRLARNRILREWKARGASRDKSVIENVRTIGTRALIQGVVIGVLDLLLPETTHVAQPQSPAALTTDPAYPVMRSEPRENFLWLDRENASDEIARRLTAGTIDGEEAALLEHWARFGYLIIPGAIPTDVIDRALADVDEIWRKRKHVLLDVLTDGRRTYVDEADPAVRSVPHKLSDVYLLSEAALQIFMNQRITRMCELIFEKPVIGCNSLTFEYGSQQPAHIDHVYMTPNPPRRLVASWAALEDVRPEAGPLKLWAGSHKLPPFDFGNSYHYKPELESRHTEYVAREKERFPSSMFFARKGDVLLWHALFVHGGSPIINPSVTRRSMACHYFSRECVSGDAGLRPLGRNYYMTKGMTDSQ